MRSSDRAPKRDIDWVCEEREGENWGRREEG